MHLSAVVLLLVLGVVGTPLNPAPSPQPTATVIQARASPSNALDVLCAALTTGASGKNACSKTLSTAKKATTTAKTTSSQTKAKTTSSSKVKSSTSAPAASVCSLPFSSGNAGTDNSTWVDSGASSYLNNLLTKGTQDWSNRFFQQTIAGGSQGGSTYDCSDFPDYTACQGPGTTPCTTYKPPQAFYIHQAMGRLYGAFSRMHEKLVDNAIINVADYSTELTNLYGPPPKDSIISILLPILIGISVIGTIPEEISAGSAALVGALNVAAGFANLDPATDPDAFRGNLQDVAGKAFGAMGKGLQTTVNGIFSGDPNILGNKALSDVILKVVGAAALSGLASSLQQNTAVGIIEDTFSGGVMMDSHLVDSMVDNWNTRTGSLMRDAMLITAWQSSPTKGGFTIRVLLEGWQTIDPKSTGKLGVPPVFTKMTQDLCTADGTYWMQNLPSVGGATAGCVGFAQSIPGTTNGPQWLSGDLLKSVKSQVGQGLAGKYQAAITNAIECMSFGYTKNANGYPSAPTTKTDVDVANIDLKNPPVYPKCFWTVGTYYPAELAP